MSRVPKNVSRRERAQPSKTADTPPSGPAVPGADPAAGKRPNRQPPWEKEAVSSESGSFGDWLRRQRELREISLRDIAERTKISLRYLEAMEEDRFDALPAPIFAKEFLREYARSAPQREAGQQIDGDAHSAGVARKTFAIHDFPFVL